MSSVRELLEQAAFSAPALPGTAAQLRRRGDRRRRTATAAGTVLAATSLVVAVGAVAALLLAPAPPAAGPATSASPTPTPAGFPVQSLEGTRWIPDLVAAGVTTTQAYPDETEAAPRALLTFERGGLLVLDVMLPGRGTTTLRGAWTATAPEPSAGLDPALKASLRLELIPAPGEPPEVTALVSRLSLITDAEGFLPDPPPASLERMTLMLYTADRNRVVAIIDLVRPSAALPSPYPSRP